VVRKIMRLFKNISGHKNRHDDIIKKDLDAKTLEGIEDQRRCTHRILIHFYAHVAHNDICNLFSYIIFQLLDHRRDIKYFVKVLKGSLSPHNLSTQ
jgi:hypothetical protein